MINTVLPLNTYKNFYIGHKDVLRKVILSYKGFFRAYLTVQLLKSIYRYMICVYYVCDSEFTDSRFIILGYN